MDRKANFSGLLMGTCGMLILHARGMRELELDSNRLLLVHMLLGFRACLRSYLTLPPGDGAETQLGLRRHLEETYGRSL